MPKFDFECQACGRVFEATIPFGSRACPRCTGCGGETRKRIAPPAIHFKGSGFYKTDSATKPAAPGEKKGDAKQNEKGEPEKNGEKTRENPPLTQEKK